MASIEVTPKSLIVHISGMDRILALHGDFRIPREHVASVEFNPEEARRELQAFWHDTSVPGAVAPGHSLVGTYTEHGERTFWDVRHPSHAVTIHLLGERYDKVIVEVDYPEQTIAQVKEAIAK